jgi:hypothetical protein
MIVDALATGPLSWSVVASLSVTLLQTAKPVAIHTGITYTCTVELCTVNHNLMAALDLGSL